MSGLFGNIGRGADDTAMQKMQRRLLHGAHARAEYTSVAPGVAVGRVHVGVFNPGEQPERASELDVYLWLTGEFFHTEVMRRGLSTRGLATREADDAAFALAVYLDTGIAGLQGLNGSFLIAIWDGRRDEFLLINDRFGLYPHYYTHGAEGLVFSPEMAAMLTVPSVPRTVDLTAIAQYTRFQQFLDDRTWIEEIRVLPPASTLRLHVSSNSLRHERYWNWGCIPRIEYIGFDEAVDEAVRLFQRSIDARMSPNLRTGVYLSGGMDSRAILGFINDPERVTTLTYGAAGCRDVVYAGQIAKRAGSRHRWFPFNDGTWVRDYADVHLQLTEGMHSWVHMHGMSTLAWGREQFDVALSGWDGATTMGNARVVVDPVLDARIRDARDDATHLQLMYDAFCQQLTWPGLTESEAETLFAGTGERRLRGVAWDSFRASYERVGGLPRGRRGLFMYMEQHNRRLTSNMIVFARSAFEVRCPFYDQDLVSFMFSLPDPLLGDPALYRAVLTRRAPQLATVAYDHDERLPHSNTLLRTSHAALQRGKRGIRRVSRQRLFPPKPTLYADYEEYLRTDLRAWGEEILFDRRTIERGLFDADSVRGLWDRHQSGDELWTIGKIAPLMTTELALRYLLEDEPVGAERASG